MMESFTGTVQSMVNSIFLAGYDSISHNVLGALSLLHNSIRTSPHLRQTSL